MSDQVGTPNPTASTHGLSKGYLLMQCEKLRPLLVAGDAEVIKALGLEQVGWWTPGMVDGANIGALIDGKMDDNDQPVYRLPSGGE